MLVMNKWTQSYLCYYHQQSGLTVQKFYQYVFMSASILKEYTKSCSQINISYKKKIGYWSQKISEYISHSLYWSFCNVQSHRSYMFLLFLTWTSLVVTLKDVLLASGCLDCIILNRFFPFCSRVFMGIPSGPPPVLPTFFRIPPRLILVLNGIWDQ